MNKKFVTKKNSKQKLKNKKREYVKPKITSEKITIYGALCNGTASGGRKSSTGAPNFCNSNKLLS